MNNDRYRNYLTDNMRALIDRARCARDHSKTFHDTLAAVAFQQGRPMAYYEAISHLINQLDGFEIERSSVGLDPSFDPNRNFA